MPLTLGKTGGPSRRGIAQNHGFFIHLLDVRINRVTDHPIALDQFLDAVVERVIGGEAGGLDLFVGHDVVAFVRVFADFGFQDDEIGDVLLDFFAQFLFDRLASDRPTL